MIPAPSWLDREKPYLVGISGGRDSIALHHWLVRHHFKNLTYCHLNHKLRGDESDGDEAFLRDLLGPSLISEQADVTAFASSKKLSLETAAREARHRFFHECATATGCSEILLAHHADDQAETILFNLLRGSAGAKGMSPRHTIDGLTFLRPFLEVRRSEIDLFLSENHHFFREDSSNTEPFASRNRLRHEALPLLADILGRDPVPHLLRAHERTMDLEQIADLFLNSLNLLDPSGRIHLPTFRKLPTPVRRKALHRFLCDHQIPNLSSDLIERALVLSDPGDPDSPPSLNLPGGQRLRRKESRLFISA